MKEYTIEIKFKSNQIVGRETEIIAKSLEIQVPGFFKDLGKEVNYIESIITHKEV